MRFVLITCLAICFPSSLLAQQKPDRALYRINDVTLTVISTQKTVELPCAPTTWLVEEAELIGDCDEGVLFVSLDEPTEPVPTEVVRTSEPIDKLFRLNGVLWVATPSGRRPYVDWAARPVKKPAVVPEQKPDPVVEKPEVVPEKPESVPEKPEIVSTVITGTVVIVEPGFAIVDFGEGRAITDGTHIEFYRTEEVDLGGGEVVQKDRLISIGEVETVSASRSKVALGLNEIVPVGAKARTTDLPVTRRTISPRRVGGVVETSFLVRPFLALGTLGGGAIIDGSISYLFDAPFSAEFFLSPFGFGIAEQGNILTFAGNVFGSYDTNAFQVGLGVGASKINTLSATRTSDFILGRGNAPTYRAGLSIAQIARLGSRDGLHVRVLNNFVLENEEFNFGGITAEGFVPLKVFVDNAWFLVRGGGGVPGHLFGETGLRLLARGNGGKGSVYFTTTVGFGNITGETYRDCQGIDYGNGDYFPLYNPDDRPITGTVVDGVCREEFDYGGPLVGFGMSFRM